MDTVGVVHTDANFILAVSPLLVPVFDVLHVVLARLKNGRNPFRADKTHIHHRLLQKGFGQDWTVVLILGLAASYTLVNVLLAPYLNVTVILLLDAAVWFIFNSRLLQPYKRHEKKGLRKGGFGKGGFGNGNLQKNSSENATHF